MVDIIIKMCQKIVKLTSEHVCSCISIHLILLKLVFFIVFTQIIKNEIYETIKVPIHFCSFNIYPIFIYD